MSPTDKVNKSEAKPSNSSAIQAFEQGRNNASAGAVGNVVPQQQSGQKEANAEPVMKARAAAAQSPFTPQMGPPMGAQSLESDQITPKTGSIDLPDHPADESTTTLQSDGLAGGLAGGSEKLRAEIIARAREAESRAREA